MLDWLSILSIAVTLLFSFPSEAGSFSLSYCWKADAPVRVEAWLAREGMTPVSEAMSLRFGLMSTLHLGHDGKYAVTLDYKGKRCILDAGVRWRNLGR